MNTQQRHKALLLGLVAAVGAGAISAQGYTAAGSPSVSVTLTNPAQVQQVMGLADSMGFDYVIRPKVSANGQFQAGVVEIAVGDRIAYAALRRMLAN